MLSRFGAALPSRVCTSTAGRMIARLVRTGQAEPVAFHYGRVKPKRKRKFNRHARRWRCGTRGRKPGQMVRIDHLSAAIDAGFSVKESEAVCPVSKLCCLRACSRATAACASKLLDHLIRQAPFDLGPVQVDGGSESAAEFETACRRRGIALFALPPKSPICNGCVERANAAGRIRRSDKRRPCRRITGTSAKARLPPEKSHMH